MAQSGDAGSGEEGDEDEAMDDEDEEEIDVAKTGVYGPVDQDLNNDNEENEESDEEESRPLTSKQRIPQISLQSPLPNRNRSGKQLSRARSSSSNSIRRHISRKKPANALPTPTWRGKNSLLNSTSTSTTPQASSALQLRAENERKRSAQTQSTSNKKPRSSMSDSAQSASNISLAADPKPASVGSEDADQEEEEESDYEDELVAEEILNVSVTFPGNRLPGKISYLVKWAHSDGQPSWEDAKQLGKLEVLIGSFHQKYQECPDPKVLSRMENNPKRADWRFIKGGD
ncbi:uncharacterized protein BDZ99DRAFT_467545 [Mytilinidion resinicola]|uniref:Chromo domain-containing protein n=1 Tax=Mytilinidion resinicola TaxID=574789 RepID=A0A6A6Y6M4_9PEZI|nr:uncharacterized protein BDZ99DRAFT_467545 [Mytilinidion resinicola]KAF2804173.1 hypothetical protein BDZ99DRAFT_467545 [Mytilinidion resinicola]